MLSITNLHAGYGKVEVLHGISMEVPKGKVVTLIGSQRRRQDHDDARHLRHDRADAKAKSRWTAKRHRPAWSRTTSPGSAWRIRRKAAACSRR